MPGHGIQETVNFFLVITGELAVLFIGISFLIGLLQEYIPPQKIQQVMGGDRNWIINNSLGAGLGALTPFCSCSTIPILLGLLNGGVPFGGAMSFLISSPLLNPVILSLLIALLGFRIATTYIVIIFPAAVLVGYIWDKLGLAGEVKKCHHQEQLASKDR